MTPDNIKAIRDKQKTQTRRLDHLKEINKAPNLWKWIGYDQAGRFSFRFEPSGDVYNYFPRYRIGEAVYIKEAYEFYNRIGTQANIKYIRDGLVTWVYIPKDKPTPKKGYHSPLFLPEWAARTFVKILDVRPERLQAITLEDAKAEGAEPLYKTAPNTFGAGYIWTPHGYRDGFIKLWDSINGKAYPFDGNWWVFRYCFNLMEDKR